MACLSGCLYSALVLSGCSTPQPIAPIAANEAPPATAAIFVPPAEKNGAALQREEATPPVAEENNIIFALRSASVDDTGKGKLRQHAARLKDNRKARVLLVGHADDQGSRSYNLAITEERLMAVAKLLRSYGVSARQIRRNRSGRVKNATPCTTNECRQQLRSVELVYAP